MGYIEENKIDAFLSYARDDSPGGYVRDFYSALFTHFKAEFTTWATSIAQETGTNFGPGPSDLPEIFFDENGLAINGSLDDELATQIKRSTFLFIFVGRGYLNSEWCHKELDWFEESVGGKEQEMLKRIFVIMLDQEAEGEWEDDWPRDEKPIFVRAFKPSDSGSKGTRIRTKLDADGDSTKNPKFEELINRLARQMVERAKELIRVPEPQAPRNTITFGAVTEDLDEIVQQLINQLSQAPNAPAIDWIDRGTVSEEINKGSGALRNALADTELYVQLYSDAKVEFRGVWPGGGHLTYQRQQIDSQRTRLLYWRVKPESEDAEEQAKLESKGLEAEDEPRHLEVIEELDARESTRTGAPSTLEAELRRLIGHSVEGSSLPKLYLPGDSADESVVFDLAERMEELWRQRNDPKSDIKCYPINAEEFQNNQASLMQDCVGIVLVFRTTDIPSLGAQSTNIDTYCIKHNLEPIRRVAAFETEGPLFWRKFDCQYDRGGNHIDVDERQVSKFLDEVEETLRARHGQG